MSAAAGEVKRSEPMQAHKGYYREQCLQLDAGQSLQFQFSTPHPVDFNIHHHADPKTIYAVRQRVDSELHKSVVIKAGGEYCFMWKNVDAYPAAYPITLTYELH